MVRRDVFAKLKACMKRRGRLAYQNVDMDQVRENAEQLPTSSVPPPSIKSLPLDRLLDNAQIRTSTTLVSTPSNIEEAADMLKVLRPNGVV